MCTACVYGVCVRCVCTAFGFLPNPLDLLKFFSNPPDERVGLCVWRVNMVCEYGVCIRRVSIFFLKVSALYVTRNSLVRRKVWAPKCRPLRLPLAAHSRNYFSRESPFAGLSRVSSLGFLVFSISSLSSPDLDVSAPSFCSPLVTRCNKECSPLVVQGRENKECSLLVMRGRENKVLLPVEGSRETCPF